MMKLALLLAILAIVTLYKIYKDYEGDRKKALIDIALLLFLLVATGFSKYIRIYLPLFVLHLLLLVIAWGSYYLYLFGRKRQLLLILLPLASILLFFGAGLFFAD